MNTPEQNHYLQVGLARKEHCDMKNRIGYTFEECPECQIAQSVQSDRAKQVESTNDERSRWLRALQRGVITQEIYDSIIDRLDEAEENRHEGAFEVHYVLPRGHFCRVCYGEQALELFVAKLRREARIMSNGIHVGRVWKDGARWNWFYDPSLVTPYSACNGQVAQEITMNEKYNKLGGKYVSYEFSDREITMQLNKGGFEPNERADVDTMVIGGYLPENDTKNPAFNYAINGEDTGFEWYWGDMPKSFQNKLWNAAS